MWLLVAGCAHPPPPAPAVAPAPASGEAARGWYLRARIAEARGDWPEAERAWRWLGRVDPTAAAGPIGLARALVALGRVDEALPLLGAAARAGVPGAWSAWATAAPDAERDAVFATWAAADPSAEGALARGEAWRARGRPGEAVDAWLVAAADRGVVGASAAAFLIDGMQAACRPASVAAWLTAQDAWGWGPPWSTLGLAAADAAGLSNRLALREAEAVRLGPGGPGRAAWQAWGEALREAGDPRAIAVGDALVAAGDPTGDALAARVLEDRGALDAARARWAASALGEAPLGVAAQLRLAVRAGDASAADAWATRATAWAAEAEVADALALYHLSRGAEDAARAAAAAPRADGPGAAHQRLAEAAWQLGREPLARSEAWAAAAAGDASAARQLAVALRAAGESPDTAALRWQALAPADPDAWAFTARDEPAWRAVQARDPCHADARAALAVTCADWVGVWEVAPHHPALAVARGACAGIPPAPEPQ
jgi:hypothetical protein